MVVLVSFLSASLLIGLYFLVKDQYSQHVGIVANNEDALFYPPYESIVNNDLEQPDVSNVPLISAENPTIEADPVEPIPTDADTEEDSAEEEEIIITLGGHVIDDEADLGNDLSSAGSFSPETQVVYAEESADEETDQESSLQDCLENQAQLIGFLIDLSERIWDLEEQLSKVIKERDAFRLQLADNNGAPDQNAPAHEVNDTPLEKQI